MAESKNMIETINLTDSEDNDDSIITDIQNTCAEIVDYGILEEDEDTPLEDNNNLVSVNSPNDVITRLVNIKIVDCFKHPSYYGKYQTQILEKICEANKDPLLINKTTHEATNEPSSPYKLSPILIVDSPELNKTKNDLLKIEKNYEVKEKLQIKKTYKEDLEILNAIKQRNLEEIDLKKNKGLIGVKIKHKVITEIDCKRDLKKSVTAENGQSKKAIKKLENEKPRKIGILDSVVDKNKAINKNYQKKIKTNSNTEISDTKTVILSQVHNSATDPMNKEEESKCTTQTKNNSNPEIIKTPEIIVVTESEKQQDKHKNFEFAKRRMDEQISNLQKDLKNFKNKIQHSSEPKNYSEENKTYVNKTLNNMTKLNRKDFQLENVKQNKIRSKIEKERNKELKRVIKKLKKDKLRLDQKSSKANKSHDLNILNKKASQSNQKVIMMNEIKTNDTNVQDITTNCNKGPVEKQNIFAIHKEMPLTVDKMNYINFNDSTESLMNIHNITPTNTIRKQDFVKSNTLISSNKKGSNTSELKAFRFTSPKNKMKDTEADVTNNNISLQCYPAEINHNANNMMQKNNMTDEAFSNNVSDLNNTTAKSLNSYMMQKTNHAQNIVTSEPIHQNHPPLITQNMVFNFGQINTAQNNPAAMNQKGHHTQNVVLTNEPIHQNNQPLINKNSVFKLGHILSTENISTATNQTTYTIPKTNDIKTINSNGQTPDNSNTKHNNSHSVTDPNISLPIHNKLMTLKNNCKRKQTVKINKTNEDNINEYLEKNIIYNQIESNVHKPPENPIETIITNRCSNGTERPQGLKAPNNNIPNPQLSAFLARPPLHNAVQNPNKPLIYHHNMPGFQANLTRPTIIQQPCLQIRSPMQSSPSYYRFPNYPLHSMPQCPQKIPNVLSNGQIHQSFNDWNIRFPNSVNMPPGICDVVPNIYFLYTPPLPPPPPPPYPLPPPYSQISNFLPENNSSIIGRNNEGIVKKINLASSVNQAVETKTIKDSKQRTEYLGNDESTKTQENISRNTPQTIPNKNIIEEVKIIGNKSSVSELKRPIQENIKNAQENKTKYRPGPLSKKLKLNSSTPERKNEAKAPPTSNKYSAPVLPIPTYEKVLSERSTPKQKPTPKRVDTMKDGNSLEMHKRNQPVQRQKTVNAKKISLAEYKTRNVLDIENK